MPRMRTSRTPTPWTRTSRVSPSVTLTTMPVCRWTGPLLSEPSGSLTGVGVGVGVGVGLVVCPTSGTGADPVHGQGLDSQASPSPSASRRCGSPGPAATKNACASACVAKSAQSLSTNACAGTTPPASVDSMTASSRARAVSRRRMGRMLTRSGAPASGEPGSLSVSPDTGLSLRRRSPGLPWLLP